MNRRVVQRRALIIYDDDLESERAARGIAEPERSCYLFGTYRGICAGLGRARRRLAGGSWTGRRIWRFSLTKK